MNKTEQARNYDTRGLARKLETCPTPQYAITNIQDRWHCSRSTVNRFRKPREQILAQVLERAGMPQAVVVACCTRSDIQRLHRGFLPRVQVGEAPVVQLPVSLPVRAILGGSIRECGLERIGHALRGAVGNAEFGTNFFQADASATG